jgi:EmrB/QacA subfamily drug resistance transporter
MIVSPRPSTYRQIAFLVAASFFMENLDGTIITTALPQMAVSFGVAPVDVSIGITSYLLTLAVFIPISGWVADRFGTRTTFALAIAIFTLASVLCGLSTNLVTFTLSRVVQGVGGAMMVPVGRLVVLRSTEKKDLISAIAYITWPALAAPVLGPPVGGFITTYVSWHWIFFLNLPLGLVAFAFALRLIPQIRSDTIRPLDWPGFVLSGSACALLLYGLELVSRGDFNIALVVLVFVAALALGWLSVLQFRRSPHPLLDLTTLRLPTFAVTIWGGSLFRLAIGAAPFLLPLMFQVGFGMDAFQSGLLVLALFLGNVVMKPATTRVLHRFGFRRVLIGNGLVNALVLVACAAFTPTTPVIIVLLVLFASGLARSMQFTALNTLAFADVPQTQMSDANTLSSMAQQLSMGMGVAVGAVAIRIGTLVEPWLHAEQVAGASFRIAFVLVALLALLGAVDSFALSRDAGANLRRVR